MIIISLVRPIQDLTRQPFKLTSLPHSSDHAATQHAPSSVRVLNLIPFAAQPDRTLETKWGLGITSLDDMPGMNVLEFGKVSGQRLSQVVTPADNEKLQYVGGPL